MFLCVCICVLVCHEQNVAFRMHSSLLQGQAPQSWVGLVRLLRLPPLTRTRRRRRTPHNASLGWKVVRNVENMKGDDDVVEGTINLHKTKLKLNFWWALVLKSHSCIENLHTKRKVHFKRQCWKSFSIKSIVMFPLKGDITHDSGFFSSGSLSVHQEQQHTSMELDNTLPRYFLLCSSAFGAWTIRKAFL